MTSVRKRVGGALLSAVILCGAFLPAAAADLAAIKERGALRVAVAMLSPFAAKDDDGALFGFEIDASRALAESLGVDIEYIEKPFCELVDAIVSDEADVIASGFSNMPTRRRVLDFSLPYHDTEYFLAIEKSATKRRPGLKALNTKDVSIGYQIGGVSGVVATGEFPGADLRGFSSFSQIMEALEDGEIDGAVLFGPYLDAARKIKGRKIVVPHEFALTRTIEAFATQQGNDALLDALNAWVIKRDLEGFWDELEKEWLAGDRAVAATPPPHACASAATG